MTLLEYYLLYQEEEEYRHQHPCCINCKHCYTDYGENLCYIHDITLENEEEKCDDWK